MSAGAVCDVVPRALSAEVGGSTKQARGDVAPQQQSTTDILLLLLVGPTGETSPWSTTQRPSHMTPQKCRLRLAVEGSHGLERQRGVEPLTMMFFLTGPLPRSGGGTGLMSKSSQNLAV